MKEIFLSRGELTFAFDGGRLVVMNHNLEWGDFGCWPPNSKTSTATIHNHRYFGDIIANKNVLEFPKYGVIFDFNELRNSHFMSANKIRGSHTHKSLPVLHHLERFTKKIAQRPKP